MADPACSLAEYYAERAAEYEEVYRKPERQADLARLKQLLPPLVAGRRVLEIAAGTGYWTEVLAHSAAAITAIDVNAETIAIAAQREYGPAPVSLHRADAYRLDTVPGDFDMAFCGFWWSHIPRADIPRFVAGVFARIGPGATLVLVDNRYVPGSSTPFQNREQVVADLAAVASDVTWTELDYYWLASCMLR
ncbi:MAG: class I SAM-dependent methyltransferase [Actinobacteria bacterium]|nr:class I SAM-dependent methyltransferase [Actinomycetota bacterium]